MNMIGNEILLYFTFAVLSMVSLRCIYLRKCLLAKSKLLTQVQDNLKDAADSIARLSSMEKNYNSFSSDLEKAACASKAQQTPRVLNQNKRDFRPPERYKYIHSLTQQGIAAAEIAVILAISAQEADQLVALASLSEN